MADNHSNALPLPRNPCFVDDKGMDEPPTVMEMEWLQGMRGHVQPRSEPYVARILPTPSSILYINHTAPPIVPQKSDDGNQEEDVDERVGSMELATLLPGGVERRFLIQCNIMGQSACRTGSPDAFVSKPLPRNNEKPGVLRKHCCYRCLVSATKGKKTRAEWHESFGKSFRCFECRNAHYTCMAVPVGTKRAFNMYEAVPCNLSSFTFQGKIKSWVSNSQIAMSQFLCVWQEETNGGCHHDGFCNQDGSDEVTSGEEVGLERRSSVRLEEQRVAQTDPPANLRKD